MLRWKTWMWDRSKGCAHVLKDKQPSLWKLSLLTRYLVLENMKLNMCNSNKCWRHKAKYV